MGRQVQHTKMEAEIEMKKLDRITEVTVWTVLSLDLLLFLFHIISRLGAFK